MQPQKQSSTETRAVFPVLCVVIALVFFTSMPVYRELETNFSEENGLGAAMVMLRQEIEQNESVATFLGLAGDAEMADEYVVEAQGSEQGESLALAVAAYIEAHTPTAPAFAMPLDGDLNSAHGTRVNPFYSGSMLLLESADYEEHHGIDISAARSRTVCAAMNGTVRMVGWDDSYGNYLIITHDGCETLYAHCASIGVAEGDTVTAGEEIAVAGMTGRATGVHLHFEVLVDGVSVDPCAYFGIFGGGERSVS